MTPPMTPAEIAAGRTFRDQFPFLRGVALQNGHVDHITDQPRCVIKMSSGENVGRYVIYRTERVLVEGEHVEICPIERIARAILEKENSRAE